ncbi:MAG: rhodanese-like domain-containing protein [Alphaproteobacteria bacterium]|nr:rhodanese-like domain-containing protein [Alphaproteobacteria bacterium]
MAKLKSHAAHIPISHRGLLYLMLATLPILAAALLIAATPALSQDIPTMAAPEAHEKALKGEILLIDVRTPEEWKQTGVPTSAHAITMHQDGPKFLSSLLSAAGGNAKMPVAVICRTGNRTSALVGPLQKAGFPNVINVIEGVVGGPRGPGWKTRGMPLRKWTKDDKGPELAAQ